RSVVPLLRAGRTWAVHPSGAIVTAGRSLACSSRRRRVACVRAGAVERCLRSLLLPRPHLFVQLAVDRAFAPFDDPRAADLGVKLSRPDAADDRVRVAHLAHALEAAEEQGRTDALPSQILTYAGRPEEAAPATLIHGEAGDRAILHG